MKSHGTTDDLKIEIDDNTENSKSFELNNINNIGVSTNNSINIHGIGVCTSNDTMNV